MTGTKEGFDMEFTVWGWIRDWSKFDYEEELARVDKGLPTIFIQKMIIEYVRWLRLYRPDLYMGYMIVELQCD